MMWLLMECTFPVEFDMTRALLLCLLLALTILQVFDGWTTYKIMRLGGRELNPVVRWIMEKIGAYEGLLVAKSFSIALIWVLVLNPISITPVLLGVLGILYGFIAIQNYKVLLRMK